jgi:tetratricopeptide (TPR) repeat protein
LYTPISLRLRWARPHLAAGALLVLFGAAVYSNTLSAPFVFDDIPQIQLNESIRIERLGVGELWTAFTQGPVKGRPLAYLTFALNYYAGGGDVFGFHLVNIAIHLLAGLTAYWLAFLTMTVWKARDPASPPELDPVCCRRIAFFAAAVFMLHPIQIQSVTYVVQRMNSLASLLYLFAMTMYVAGRLAERPRRRRRLWAVGFLAWLLSLLCKQNSVTLPVAVVMYEWYFFRGLSLDWLPRGWKRWLPVGGVLLVAGGLIAIVSVAQLSLIGDVFRRYQERDFTMGERLLTQPRALCVYASLAMFPWPSRFNLLHPMEASRGLLDPPQTLVAIVLLAGYVWLAVWTARRNRLISFCLVWPLVHLAVESTILPLEMIYEHRMYLPMFGVSLLAANLLDSALRRRPAVVRGAVAAAVLAALGIATYARNQVWTDAIGLWSDVIAKNPTSRRAYVNRAGLYLDRGEWSRAIEDCNRALEIDETFDAAWIGRGAAFLNSGDYRRAVTNFSAAIAVAKLNDIRVMAYKNRGAAWAAMGYPMRAIADYTRAIEMEPQSVGNLYKRANAYLRLGEYSKAIADYKRCTEIQPSDLASKNNLALLLATCPEPSQRDPKAALRYALDVNERSGWKEWTFLDTLADVYAANGDLAKAIQWQSRAVDLAPPQNRPTLQRKLDGYRAGPVRGP